MKQQINLFQPSLREPAPPFGANAMLRTIGAVLLGLSLVYGWAAVQVGTLAHEASDLAVARAGAERRYAELQARLPKRSQDDALARRVDALGADLEQTRRLMSVLSQGSFGNQFGLSPFLVGFARQHVAGTWLTRVDIAAGGTQIGIEGRAQAPELVPMVVQRLAAEPVFEGKVFSHLELDRAPGDAAVAFALATTGVKVGITHEDVRGTDRHEH